LVAVSPAAAAGCKVTTTGSRRTAFMAQHTYSVWCQCTACCKQVDTVSTWTSQGLRWWCIAATVATVRLLLLRLLRLLFGSAATHNNAHPESIKDSIIMLLKRHV
jgi:hypothetical protein